MFSMCYNLCAVGGITYVQYVLLLLWLAGLPLVGTLTADTEAPPILFTPRPVGRITAGSGSDSAWLDRPADARRVFGLAKIRRKGKWPYRLQTSTPAPPWGTLTKRVDFGRPVLPAPPPTTAEKKNDISECHLVLLYLGFFSPKFSTFLSLLPHLGLLPWGACSEVFACLRVAKKDATWPKL